jgi:hypothetical protein
MITAGGTGHVVPEVGRDRLQPQAMTVLDRPHQPADVCGGAQVGKPERATQQGFPALGV